MVTLMLAITMTSLVADAIARPMGGRRSFGRQSANVTQKAPPAAPTAPAAAPGATRPAAAPAAAGAAGAAAAAAKPSMWKGILGGALLGLGLGALFSSLGLSSALGNAIGSILMILLLVMAVMFIVRMFRRKDTPANAPFEGFSKPVPAGAPRSTTPEIGSGLNQGAFNQQPSAFQPVQPVPGTQATNEGTWYVPGDFDKEAFLRQAKSMFIRMQAAWDKGDVNDLREFTTPEVFAELKMQMSERTDNDYTDVVQIDAQMLGIEDLGSDHMASVRFSGMIKESPTAQPTPIAEVWNLTKPKNGSAGWLLAGIQQL
ncbi:Tim44 domain-containing protein [Pseudoduganella sp. GCM10020061]|uniref:Tim44 domain-containing protein n=1 Tax=Pseudoduganella sp. GCM10020061 TaxID=3317345 RepID=UPI003645DCA4